jgi:tripartite-type tricarboxylate transporter receptor subunit TctC
MMLPSRREVLFGASALSTLTLVSSGVRADTYPVRPIRLVVPFAAGGSNDVIARPWADRMGSSFGPVVIENIAGAGGAVGCASVAHAPADGYTLLLGNAGNQVVIPLASTRPGYDSARDFRAIYRLVSNGLAFAVHPSLPVKDLGQLVAYGKANPGKLSYGSAGVGTTNQLAGEMFKLQAGLPDIVHVPYRGAAPATSDLLGGQLPMIVAVMTRQLLQLHESGKLRILAVANERRMAGAPNIPTAIESGMPDLKFDGWFSLFAPKATPEPIISQLAQATRKIMSDASLLENYRAEVMEPDSDSSPEKAQQIVQQAVERLSPLIKSIQLKLG